jgi:hypothetical protein
MFAGEEKNDLLLTGVFSLFSFRSEKQAEGRHCGDRDNFSYRFRVMCGFAGPPGFSIEP